MKVLCFSGGVDSLRIFDLYLNGFIDIDAIAITRLFDFISVEKKIDQIIQIASERDVPLYINDISYGELVDKIRTYGWCGTGNRHLTYLKFESTNLVQSDFTKILGFTYDELLRVSSITNIYPLIDRRITHYDNRVWSILTSQYDDDIYKYLERSGCPFCRFKSLYQFYIIKTFLKRDWERLCQLESDVGNPIHSMFLEELFQNEYFLDEKFKKDALASIIDLNKQEKEKMEVIGIRETKGIYDGREYHNLNISLMCDNPPVDRSKGVITSTGMRVRDLKIKHAFVQEIPQIGDEITFVTDKYGNGACINIIKRKE